MTSADCYGTAQSPPLPFPSHSRQQMSRFLREKCLPFPVLLTKIQKKTKQKIFLSFCSSPNLRHPRNSQLTGRGLTVERALRGTHGRAHPQAKTQVPRRKPPTSPQPLFLSSFLFTPTQKQINYTGWMPPLIYLMKSMWRLPLLTNIQASLFHLGPEQRSNGNKLLGQQNMPVNTKCIVPGSKAPRWRARSRRRRHSDRFLHVNNSLFQTLASATTTAASIHTS